MTTLNEFELKALAEFDTEDEVGPLPKVSYLRLFKALTLIALPSDTFPPSVKERWEGQMEGIYRGGGLPHHHALKECLPFPSGCGSSLTLGWGAMSADEKWEYLQSGLCPSCQKHWFEGGAPPPLPSDIEEL